ncbi:head maturation protease, ClpP-related [Gaoshiqia sp. Z1-71]|uniref:head maturation protease, ClpP-related n=1 Tax=Gaoshiqia hydrogeniformans TaxID=3290090 RepID=UPI003BF79A52
MKSNEEIKLYGLIGEWKNNGESFSDMLDKLEKSDCKNLTIRLHSYGGSVFEGVVMFNALRRSKMNIKIVVDGVAASMASMLLMAVDEVEIAENGFIMVHTPSGITHGNAKTHKQAMKLLSDVEDNFSKQYSQRTGLSVDEVKANWFDGNDHWLNADEAIKYNFAKRKVSALAKNITNLDKEMVSSMEPQNVYSRFVALLNNQNDKEMKNELIEMFSIEGVTAESSDTAILNKLKEKFDALEQQVSSSKQKEEADKSNKIKSMLDNAQKEGKINKDIRASLETVGRTSGLDVLANVISGMSKRTPIADLVKTETRQATEEPAPAKDRAKWTLEDYRMYAPNELRNNPKLYDELVKSEYGQD